MLSSSLSPRAAGAPTPAGRPNRVVCTIIACNEADRIERAIRSVSGLVDETLVIDSGSTDATVALCERLGARVVHHPWSGYGPQKRFAWEVANADWILNLDADEWLSEDLREELARILGSSAAANALFPCSRAGGLSAPRATCAVRSLSTTTSGSTTGRWPVSGTPSPTTRSRRPTTSCSSRATAAQELSRLRPHRHQDDRLLPPTARGGDRAEPRRLAAHGVRVPLPVLQVLHPSPPHLRRRRRLRLRDRAVDRALGADLHPKGVVRSTGRKTDPATAHQRAS